MIDRTRGALPNNSLRKWSRICLNRFQLPVLHHLSRSVSSSVIAGSAIYRTDRNAGIAIAIAPETYNSLQSATS